MSEPEKCWFANKHKQRGEEPLDCLECKRMIGKTIMDKPESRELQLFLDGFRLAMMQVAFYCTKEEHPLPKYHINMCRGIDTRMKCAIDRGVPLEVILLALDDISGQVLDYIMKRGESK